MRHRNSFSARGGEGSGMGFGAVLYLLSNPGIILPMGILFMVFIISRIWSNLLLKPWLIVALYFNPWGRA